MILRLSFHLAHMTLFQPETPVLHRVIAATTAAVKGQAAVLKPGRALEVSLLDDLVQFFLRANGYSLVAALGVAANDVGDRGAGSFSGPFVSGGQALLVLASYLVVLLAASGWLLRRRDVV